VIARAPSADNTTWKRGQNVEFDLSFSAKGPLAEHIALV
jgi:cold shock CspA family protein